MESYPQPAWRFIYNHQKDTARPQLYNKYVRLESVHHADDRYETVLFHSYSYERIRTSRSPMQDTLRLPSELARSAS